MGQKTVALFIQLEAIQGQRTVGEVNHLWLEANTSKGDSLGGGDASSRV